MQNLVPGTLGKTAAQQTCYTMLVLEGRRSSEADRPLDGTSAGSSGFSERDRGGCWLEGEMSPVDLGQLEAPSLGCATLSQQSCIPVAHFELGFG